MSALEDTLARIADGLSALGLPVQIGPEILGPAIVLALFGLVAFALRTKRRGRRGRRSGATRKGPKRKGWTPRIVSAVRPDDMSNPLNQMEAINRVDFEVQRLLNKSEARILPVLERIVAEIGEGHRVMAQTSMGEVLRPRAGSGNDKARRQAFASINSKRLDFAIFDRYGMLACAIEYQGRGHHQNKAFMRDAVKREAVRRAGVAWIEVNPGDTPAELASQVRKALGAPTPASGPAAMPPDEAPPPAAP